MLKKFVISFVALFVILAFSAPSILGFSILNFGHAVKVSTSLTAKLACSARYISGLPKEQIIEDLASYSPVVKIVNLRYDDTAKTTSASLYGMATTSAQFLPATGCSLVMGDSNKLLNIKAVELSNSTQPWPVGNTVTTHNKQIQKLLNTYVANDHEQGLNTRAMLVVHKGKIIAESYASNVSFDTPLLGWSMAKSVTAMLLGRMQQLGKVDTSNTELFDNWSNDERSHLSLENLLQMSSGLAFDETYAPGSDATHMLFTAVSASDVALNSHIAQKAGHHFSYSSGTTNLLSRYIHQQLGNDTQNDVNFLYNELFKSLGLQNSIFETDSSGVMVGSSYLYASGRDWARLGLVMLNNGAINDGALFNGVGNEVSSIQQLIPKDWVEKASSPNKSRNDKRYGYQFWLNSGEDELRWPTIPIDAYAMMGNRKQSVMIIPSKDAVLVRLGWTRGDYPMEQYYSNIIKQLYLTTKE